MTSAVPAQPRPLKGAATVVLAPTDWAALHQLAMRYGVDELIRVLRLHQMIAILQPQEHPNDGERP